MNIPEKGGRRRFAVCPMTERAMTSFREYLPVLRMATPRSKRQRELQITLDHRPWTLGHALSFSRNENPGEKYTAVTRIQQSAGRWVILADLVISCHLD
jgi:hypothetical protein